MTDAHAIPELDRKGLREFGLVTGGMLVLIFGLLLPWLFDASFPVWPWVVLGVLAAIALAIPEALRPVYYWWMRLALLLSKITTPIILGIVFFLVLTPMGLIMRLFGNDPMRRAQRDDTETYRIASSKTDKERLEKPF
ncbi:MAG: sxtJ [Gammaproteobacteria bacterium]|nr:sxtJ [Gammaproteobacteria bacterium]